MTEEWFITQNSAIRKSEVIFIVTQQAENGTFNINFVTKQNVSFNVYDNIPNLQSVAVIIDNLVALFDDNHVPVVDLKKKNETKKVASDDEAE